MRTFIIFIVAFATIVGALNLVDLVLPRKAFFGVDTGFGWEHGLDQGRGRFTLTKNEGDIKCSIYLLVRVGSPYNPSFELAALSERQVEIDVPSREGVDRVGDSLLELSIRSTKQDGPRFDWYSEESIVVLHSGDIERIEGWRVETPKGRDSPKYVMRRIVGRIAILIALAGWIYIGVTSAVKPKKKPKKVVAGFGTRGCIESHIRNQKSSVHREVLREVVSGVDLNSAFERHGLSSISSKASGYRAYRQFISQLKSHKDHLNFYLQHNDD